MTEAANQGLATLTLEARDTQMTVRKEPVKIFVRGRSGTLDTTFGIDGILDNPMGAEGKDMARDAVVLADGRMLVVGMCRATKETCIVRLSPAGVSEPGYGAGGVAIGGYHFPTVAAAHGDGIVVLSGGFFPGGPTGFMVLSRFDANGAPDPAFGDGGTRIFPANYLGVSNIAVDTKGRVLIGTAIDDNGTLRAAVLRTLPNGALDPAFNGTGTFMPQATTQCTVIGLGLRGDKPFFSTACQKPGTSVVAQITETGGLDPTFGANAGATAFPGYLAAGNQTPAVPFGAAANPDGTLLVPFLGGANEFQVAKVAADGKTLSSGFGTAGVVSFGLAAGLDLQLVRLPDGSVLVGRLGKLYKLRPDGMPDASFGTAGVATTGLAYQRSIPYGPARVVVVGGRDAGSGTTAPTMQRYWL